MSSAVLTKSLSKSIFVGAVHTNCTLVHGWEYLFVIIIIIIITIIIEVFVDESIYLVFGTYRLLYYSETVL